MLAATWNLTSVPAGFVAEYVNDVQCGVRFAAGFASLSDDTNVPLDGKPVRM